MYLNYVIICISIGLLMSVSNILIGKEAPLYPLHVASFIACPPLILVAWLFGFIYSKLKH